MFLKRMISSNRFLCKPIITAATIAVVRADVFMNIVIYVLQEDVVTLETGNDLLENESFVIYLHKAVTLTFFK
ncbi:hypothetical protein BDA99DRAFT_527561 [Phascolomyces articulosus]|uniref:Uncharacterized protein n=1 Tax=Phascolomyces articulosus TaxID=60185 RepID=A0AAD5JWX2_9FUNG|nr:hypothetical protein BDA99DRAFT_527561 [Phascolomyces articulosus]